MEYGMEYDEIVRRIGVIRERAQLSCRELSGRIGKNANYISKLECENFQISIDTLMEILEVCQTSPATFFHPFFDRFEDDLPLLNFICSIDKDQKKAIRAFVDTWLQV